MPLAIAATGIGSGLFMISIYHYWGGWGIALTAGIIFMVLGYQLMGIAR